jgi:8-oxo-dGTP pyrophosphatase MutT (NUDIX family)
MKLWKRLGERRLLQTRVFDVKQMTLEHPGRTEPVDFYAISSGDWVNVVPLTPGGQVLLIRQYRAGTHEICLEIPGGMVDPGERPEQAAARELAEETGFVAARLEPLGMVKPNPAIQDNRCFTFLALGCEQRTGTDFDPDEHIETELAPLAGIPAMIADGRIDHALVVAAFYHFFVARSSATADPGEHRGPGSKT